MGELFRMIQMDGTDVEIIGNKDYERLRAEAYAPPSTYIMQKDGPGLVTNDSGGIVKVGGGQVVLLY